MLLPFLQLNTAEVQSFARPLLGYLPQEVMQHGKFSEAMAELLASLDALASPATCATRAQRFAPSLAPMAFAERVIDCTQEKMVVVGLRFRHLDPAFPFAHITLNFNPTEADLAALRVRTQQEFLSLRLCGMTLR